MQKVNRDPHILLLGLAGTGKSFEINKIINNKEANNEIQTNEICSLTFDKALSAKYKNDFAWSNKSNSFTIHGFCYHVLSELLMLPEGFRNNSNGDIEEEPTGRDYNKLISLFLGLSNHKIKRTKIYQNYISKIKIIICDEAQDFREDYIEIVKKIKVLSNEAQLIIAGDHHQQIYLFQNRNNSTKLSNVLNNPKLIFDNEEFDRIILNKNHRSDNHYLDYFMNCYLKKNYETPIEELYTNLPEFFNNKEIKQSRKMPLIKLFTNREEEEDFVKAKISGIDNNKNTIAVIARNNKTLKRYSDLSNRKNITASTVHKVKGDGFDYIFYIGFEYNIKSDSGIKTICYTGISRPKKKLFITSSFPNKNIFEVFEKGSFVYRNVQKNISKSFPIRKKIKQNKEVTLNKITGTYLDSLVLKVKAEKSPFLTYIKKEGTEQKKWSSTQRFKNEDGLEYSLNPYESKNRYINKC
jgi:superfamily I DNA/RNA helicase